MVLDMTFKTTGEEVDNCGYDQVEAKKRLVVCGHREVLSSEDVFMMFPKS